MERISRLELLEEDHTSSPIDGNALYKSSTAGIYRPSLICFILKRLLDIGLSLLGIVVLMPVFIVIAICIKINDGSHVLYRREMIGLHGRHFHMLKFRTKIPNADTYLQERPELMQAFQQNMKLQHDPRVTRVGQFLRKTYLDELPKLFNVLVGHMSLVGPRAILQTLKVFIACTGV